MQLQFSPKEQEAFESLAKTHHGNVLVSYLERLVTEAVDVRNIKGENKEAQIEARILLSTILTENLIDRLKVLGGRELTENNNEFI